MGKKAVLIGINYPGTKAELRGCINDVYKMHQCLIERYGFEEDDIKILIDTDPSFTQPTGKNIRRALRKLVKNAEEGDFLFVHYSGHGTRLPAETGEADDTGYDECIVPTDMNLITDEDFRNLVCKVPDGCRITIVSDSCHSGGLLSGAKEQIGESFQNSSSFGSGSSSSGFSFSGFLKQAVKDTVSDVLVSRGIDLPFNRNRNYDSYEQPGSVIDEERYQGDREFLKSRSLPLSTLIDLLKDRSGKDDLNVGQIRATLFDMFGKDSSPKVKKFMKVILDKLRGQGGGSGEVLAAVGGLAMEFFKQKLEEKDEGYAQPAEQAHVDGSQQVYAGTANCSKMPRNGILLSGCQSDQTSADASPSGNHDEAYGAFSNAIQTILRKADEDAEVTNQIIVSKARRLVKRQGFTQRPGLYCSDDFVDVPFIC